MSVCVCKRERQRGRETETERERDKEGDRKRGRQRGRATEIETKREREGAGGVGSGGEFLSGNSYYNTRAKKREAFPIPYGSVWCVCPGPADTCVGLCVSTPPILGCL